MHTLSLWVGAISSLRSNRIRIDVEFLDSISVRISCWYIYSPFDYAATIGFFFNLKVTFIYLYV